METIKKVNEVYKERGLKSVYSFLKANSIKYKRVVHEFGLKGTKYAETEKSNFIEKIEPNTFKAHYYSVSVKSRKTGFSYNKIRAIEIILI